MSQVHSPYKLHTLTDTDEIKFHRAMVRKRDHARIVGGGFRLPVVCVENMLLTRGFLAETDSLQI